MPLYTEHLNLAKPVEDEFYNIAVPNGNMDILDEHVRLLAEKNRLLEEEVAALRGELANKANKEQPPIFQLELCEGLITRGENIYWKLENGQVFINYAVRSVDEENTISNEVISKLPAGFIPYKTVSAAGAGYTLGAGTNRVACLTMVNASGDLIIHSFSESVWAVQGQITYLAAQYLPKMHISR